MINKQPRGLFAGYLQKGFKTLVVAELLACAGAYAFWHRCNTNREFRYYLSENFPAALDLYYKSGELIDDHYKAREIDLEVWTKENRKNKQH